jgi:CHAT domain-containing protein
MNIIISSIGKSLLLLSLILTIQPSQARSRDPLQAKSTKIAQTTGAELFQKGSTAYQARQLKDAVRYWQQALTSFQSARDDRGELETLGALSAALIELGEYDRVITYGDKLLASSLRLKILPTQAQALGNLGIAYQKLGDYPKSIKSNQQALVIFKSLNMGSAEGQLLSNLGNTYAIIGDYDGAIAVYKRSLEIARSSKTLQQQGNVLSNLGAVYTNKGDDRQALEYYQESLTIARSLKDIPLQIGVLINLGTTHYLLGDRDLGTKESEQAVVLAKQIENPQLLGDVLSNLGLIYADRREYTKSIEAHQQSVQIAIAGRNPRAEALARNNLAHTFLDTNQLAAAQQQLRSAIESLDRVRSTLSDLEQVNIFDTQAATYNLLEQVLIADRNPEAALEVAEQGRARAFAQKLASRLQVEAIPPSIAKIRQIAKQQNATIVSYTVVPDKQFKFRGKQRGEKVGLFIWVVQPNGQVTFRQKDLRPLRQQKISFEDLADASRCLRADRMVCIKVDRFASSTRKFTKGTYPGLEELYQLTIAPIADLLPQNPDDHVIFIPHSSLLRVPFAALQTPDGKFLIEKHTILSAPSIQVLDLTHQQHLRQANDVNRSAIVVGNPTMPAVIEQAGKNPVQLPTLINAGIEAKTVGKLLMTKPLIGAEATKANVFKNIEQARFIHLATHGLINYVTKAGLDSTEVPGALALAPTSTDEGLLTAREILNLNLNAKLVVLSACDTGRGRITGDGVIGLSRAWISAGVPSTIVSLRQVPDDSTTLLMTSFYQNFTKTSNIARSLRQAMLETMKTNREPVRWAAFMLIGEAQSKF